MPEQDISRGNPIHLKAFVDEQRQLVASVQRIMDDMFSGPPTEAELDLQRGMSEILFGQRQKQIIRPDGSTEFVDYTREEIAEGMNEAERVASNESRNRMGEDVSMAMDYQWLFFRNSRSPLAANALMNVAIVRTLLNHFVSTRDDIDAAFPAAITEPFYMAEVLETVRQVVLQPASYAYRGIGEDGGLYSIRSFDDELVEGEVNARRDQIEVSTGYAWYTKEFKQAEREMIGQTVEGFQEAEWEAIVVLENRYLLEYIQEMAGRKVSRGQGIIYFLASIVDEKRQFIHDEKELNSFAKQNQARTQLAEALRSITDISQLMFIVQTHLGKGAIFQDVLNLFSPVQLESMLDRDLDIFDH